MKRVEVEQHNKQSAQVIATRPQVCIVTPGGVYLRRLPPVCEVNMAPSVGESWLTLVDDVSRACELTRG